MAEQVDDTTIDSSAPDRAALFVNAAAAVDPKIAAIIELSRVMQSNRGITKCESPLKDKTGILCPNQPKEYVFRLCSSPLNHNICSFDVRDMRESTEKLHARVH